MCGGKHRLGDIGQFLVTNGDELTRLSEDQWRAALGITEPPTFKAQMPNTSETGNT
jgi:hypothetical protein